MSSFLLLWSVLFSSSIKECPCGAFWACQRYRNRGKRDIDLKLFGMSVYLVQSQRNDLIAIYTHKHIIITDIQSTVSYSLKFIFVIRLHFCFDFLVFFYPFVHFAWGIFLRVFLYKCYRHCFSQQQQTSNWNDSWLNWIRQFIHVYTSHITMWLLKKIWNSIFMHTQCSCSKNVCAMCICIYVHNDYSICEIETKGAFRLKKTEWNDSA